MEVEVPVWDTQDLLGVDPIFWELIRSLGVDRLEYHKYWAKGADCY